MVSIEGEEHREGKRDQKYLVALTSGKVRRLLALAMPPSVSGAKARHEMNKQTIKACNIFIFFFHTRFLKKGCALRFFNVYESIHWKRYVLLFFVVEFS